MTDTVEIRRDKLAHAKYFSDPSKPHDCPACALGQYAQQRAARMGTIADPAMDLFVRTLARGLHNRGVNLADIVQNSDTLSGRFSLTPGERLRLEDRIVAAFAKGGVVATFTGEYPA